MTEEEEEVARLVVDHASGTYRACMVEHGSLVSVSRVSGVAKEFSPVVRWSPELSISLCPRDENCATGRWVGLERPAINPADRQVGAQLPHSRKLPRQLIYSGVNNYPTPRNCSAH